MPVKTKNPSSLESFASLTKQIGLLLMTAAATIGMIHLPEHPQNKIAVLAQPAMVFAGPNYSQVGGEANNIRRERDETAPHYVSYSVGQRTPGRTGRV